MRKPHVIERIVVSTEPRTEKKPFTPSPRRRTPRTGGGVSDASVARPIGMNAPSASRAARSSRPRAPAYAERAAEGGVGQRAHPEQVERGERRDHGEERAGPRGCGSPKRPARRRRRPVKIRIDMSVTVSEYVG